MTKSRKYVGTSPRLLEITPKHLHEKFVPVTREDVTDLALLPQLFKLFAADIRQSLQILSGQVLPLLAELRDIVKQHDEGIRTLSARVAYLEQSKGSHAEVLDKHEAKHGEHSETITGVFKRLTVLEETAIPKPPVRTSKKRKRSS